MLCPGSRALAGFSALGDNNTDDCYGHGSHVAGTVGGVNVGVAKNITLWAGDTISEDTCPVPGAHAFTLIPLLEHKSCMNAQLSSFILLHIKLAGYKILRCK